MNVSHTYGQWQIYNFIIPFFKEYKTPFGVPPFNLIKNEHFLEAFTKGIAEHKNEIQLIVSNNETPTFQNTIMALENSGKLLNKVSTVFYNINSANTSEEIQGIAQKLAPVTSAHQDEITLNLAFINSPSKELISFLLISWGRSF